MLFYVHVGITVSTPSLRVPTPHFNSPVDFCMVKLHLEKSFPCWCVRVNNVNNNNNNNARWPQVFRPEHDGTCIMIITKVIGKIKPCGSWVNRNKTQNFKFRLCTVYSYLRKKIKFAVIQLMIIMLVIVQPLIVACDGHSPQPWVEPQLVVCRGISFLNEFFLKCLKKGKLIPFDFRF